MNNQSAVNIENQHELLECNSNNNNQHIYMHQQQQHNQQSTQQWQLLPTQQTTSNNLNTNNSNINADNQKMKFLQVNNNNSSSSNFDNFVQPALPKQNTQPQIIHIRRQTLSTSTTHRVFLDSANMSDDNVQHINSSIKEIATPAPTPAPTSQTVVVQARGTLLSIGALGNGVNKIMLRRQSLAVEKPASRIINDFQLPCKFGGSVNSASSNSLCNRTVGQRSFDELDLNSHGRGFNKFVLTHQDQRQNESRVTAQDYMKNIKQLTPAEKQLIRQQQVREAQEALRQEYQQRLEQERQEQLQKQQQEQQQQQQLLLQQQEQLLIEQQRQQHELQQQQEQMLIEQQRQQLELAQLQQQELEQQQELAQQEQELLQHEQQQQEVIIDGQIITDDPDADMVIHEFDETEMHEEYAHTTYETEIKEEAHQEPEIIMPPIQKLPQQINESNIQQDVQAMMNALNNKNIRFFSVPTSKPVPLKTLPYAVTMPSITPARRQTVMICKNNEHVDGDFFKNMQKFGKRTQDDVATVLKRYKYSEESPIKINKNNYDFQKKSFVTQDLQPPASNGNQINTPFEPAHDTYYRPERCVTPGRNQMLTDNYYTQESYGSTMPSTSQAYQNTNLLKQGKKSGMPYAANDKIKVEEAKTTTRAANGGYSMLEKNTVEDDSEKYNFMITDPHRNGIPRKYQKKVEKAFNEALADHLLSDNLAPSDCIQMSSSGFGNNFYIIRLRSLDCLPALEKLVSELPVLYRNIKLKLLPKKACVSLWGIKCIIPAKDFEMDFQKFIKIVNIQNNPAMFSTDDWILHQVRHTNVATVYEIKVHIDTFELLQETTKSQPYFLSYRLTFKFGRQIAPALSPIVLPNGKVSNDYGSTDEEDDEDEEDDIYLRRSRKKSSRKPVNKKDEKVDNSDESDDSDSTDSEEGSEDGGHSADESENRSEDESYEREVTYEADDQFYERDYPDNPDNNDHQENDAEHLEAEYLEEYTVNAASVNPALADGTTVNTATVNAAPVNADQHSEKRVKIEKSRNNTTPTYSPNVSKPITKIRENKATDLPVEHHEKPKIERKGATKRHDITSKRNIINAFRWLIRSEITQMIGGQCPSADSLKEYPQKRLAFDELRILNENYKLFEVVFRKAHFLNVIYTGIERKLVQSLLKSGKSNGIFFEFNIKTMIQLLKREPIKVKSSKISDRSLATTVDNLNNYIKQKSLDDGEISDGSTSDSSISSQFSQSSSDSTSSNKSTAELDRELVVKVHCANEERKRLLKIQNRDHQKEILTKEMLKAIMVNNNAKLGSDKRENRNSTEELEEAEEECEEEEEEDEGDGDGDDEEEEEDAEEEEEDEEEVKDEKDEVKEAEEEVKETVEESNTENVIETLDLTDGLSLSSAAQNEKSVCESGENCEKQLVTKLSTKENRGV